MKRSSIIALAAAVSVTVCSLAVIVNGDELIYNSADDPLVSLSYINEVVVAKYDEKISELSSEIAKISGENSSLKTENSNLSAAASELTKRADELSATVDELKKQLSDLTAQLENQEADGYSVVYLKLGDKLMAESPCEIILRSGTAIAVSITQNGINDITNGTELMNSDQIPQYHALLVPRGNDGRGIQITSGEAYIMVRGDYRIE